MFNRYGIIIKKVKWSKEQLDLMQKCLGLDNKNKDVHTIKIDKLKVR